MNMNKTIKHSYKTLSILAIISCLILTFVLFIPNQSVHAEYNDLNENTLVNFNQYSKFNNYLISGTTDSNAYLNHNTDNLALTFNNTHKYFLMGYFENINNNNASQFTLFFNTYTKVYSFTTTNTYFILDGINNFDFARIFTLSPNSTFNISVNINLIDLTQMFGAGNEPNLEQCREYFTTYYPYNTGIQIPYSKSYLQGYQEGAKSVYDSLTITLNSYTIGANSQIYSNNTIERGDLTFDQQYSAYAFSGVIAINLLGQVERGTNINIDFELTIPSLEGEPNVETFAEKFILYFAYVDSNNNLVNITGVKPKYIGSWVNSYKGDFALPITISTIYCYLNYNTIGDNFLPTTAIATKSDITFKGIDIAQVVNNAYNKGASDTNAKYSVGGLLYQSIYDLGKSEGIAEGNSFASGLDVIATTFTKVFSIFNIEILPGVPLTIFILLPLLFGLIMFIVKLTKGG